MTLAVSGAKSHGSSRPIASFLIAGGPAGELAGKKAPSPVNPHIMLKGVESNVKMYQSALYPAAVTFKIEPPLATQVRHTNPTQHATHSHALE